jgi:hypothetical protein
MYYKSYYCHADNQGYQCKTGIKPCNNQNGTANLRKGSQPKRDFRAKADWIGEFIISIEQFHQFARTVRIDHEPAHREAENKQGQILLNAPGREHEGKYAIHKTDFES